MLLDWFAWRLSRAVLFCFHSITLPGWSTDRCPPLGLEPWSCMPRCSYKHQLLAIPPASPSARKGGVASGLTWTSCLHLVCANSFYPWAFWFKLQADVSHVSFATKFSGRMLPWTWRRFNFNPQRLGSQRDARITQNRKPIASPMAQQNEGYWNHCSRLQSRHVAASWLFHCSMTPEKDPTKTSSSMNLQVQTWNLTRGCSLCSARHWPSTSRNLADLGEVSPRSLPFFYPKKKTSAKKPMCFLPTSLQSQHVRHPPCVSSCPPLGAQRWLFRILVGGGPGRLWGKCQRRTETFHNLRDSAETQTRLQANTRKWRLLKGPKTLFGAAMCRLNVT